MKRIYVFISIPLLILANSLVGQQPSGSSQELLKLFETGDSAGIIKILEADPQQLKADLDQGMTPLHYAVYTGNDVVFDYLMKRGMDLQAKDKRGLTPVWFTVSGVRPAMLRKLIALGADLSVKDARGNTLLHRAVPTENAELIKILLDHLGGGLKIDEKNARGMTPLLMAAGFKNTEVAQALILHGADAKATGPDGFTALQISAKTGAPDLVGFLIAHKANISVIEEKSGRTLLHEAAANGNSAVVSKLLAAGVPKNAKDKNGLTALSYARKYGNKAAADELRKAGAEDIPWQTNPGDPPFLSEGRIIAVGHIESAVNDFDGDGRPDIAVADFRHHARIFFNDAGLEFKKVVPLASAAETDKTTAISIASGDFNGDGRPDLMLCYLDAPARILLGDGKGGFKDSGQEVGHGGRSLRVADFDGDGDLDVLITEYSTPAHLYLNDGKGVLTESGQTFPSGAYAAGDIDGDGDIDIVSYQYGEPLSIWLNEKGRYVRQDRTIDVGQGSVSLYELIDTNGDGVLNIHAGGREGGSLWLNDGRGGFRKLDQAFNSGRMAAGDFDGDGRLDLVVGSSIWLNRGSGRYEIVQTLTGIVAVQAVLDIDGDGDLDLLMAKDDPSYGRVDLLLFINALRGK